MSDEPKIGETWMVTKPCREHVDYTCKPWTFRKDPAIRCLECVWERVQQTENVAAETCPASAREGDGPYRAVEGKTGWGFIGPDGVNRTGFSDERSANLAIRDLNAAFHAGAKKQREKDAAMTRARKGGLLMDCATDALLENLARAISREEGQRDA